MPENQNVRPELSQEQASNTLERVFTACQQPFDRGAYAGIYKKARKGRAFRLAVCVLLIAAAAAIVLGALGVFTVGYLRNVVVQSPPAVSSVRPPAAVSAWIEDDEVVLRLEAGSHPIDYSRITAACQEDGAPVRVSCDEENALLRLPCPRQDTVLEITVYDTEGIDYRILATITAGG